MANYVVDVFIPNQDSAGNPPPTLASFVAQMGALSLNNLSLDWAPTNIRVNSAFQAQGTLMRWYIPDTNTAQALTDYNNFVASDTWNIVPHFSAVLASSIG